MTKSLKRASIYLSIDTNKILKDQMNNQKERAIKNKWKN